MGDTGDDYKAMRAIKKERHNKFYEDNMRILHASSLSMVEYATVVHVNNDNKTYLFYPHTGRWQRKGTQHMFRGGAKAFIEWLKK